jgi:hypothetical protein
LAALGPAEFAKILICRFWGFITLDNFLLLEIDMGNAGMNPATAITLSTVRLECFASTGVSVGTGFFFVFNLEKK